MKLIRKYIKFLILLAMLLAIHNAVECQVGLRLGAGISDIIFRNSGQTPYLGYEINSITHNFPIHSFQAGFVGQLDISTRLYLNAGILYSQQGLDYSTSFLYDDIIYRLYLSYLKVPFLLKIRTNMKSNKSSSIVFGPYISGTINSSRLTEIQGIRHILFHKGGYAQCQ